MKNHLFYRVPLAITCLLISGIFFSLPARDFLYKGLLYTVLNEDAKTCQTKAGDSGGPGNIVTGDLVVPNYAYDGNVKFTVTGIGYDGFRENNDLKSVTIGDSVKTMGAYSFHKCYNLNSAIISNSITSIPKWAFSSCKNLEEVKLPDTLINIGDHGFSGCAALHSIIFPESIRRIGRYAFAGCSSITHIELPSVNYVGEMAFSGCGVKTLHIGKYLTNIRELAFSSLDSLITLKIGEGVDTIGRLAFSGCVNLTTVEIPHSVTHIGARAFTNTNLKNVDIPNSVTSIGEAAFRYCTNLSSVKLPNSLTAIPPSAFQGCTSLSEIIIPPSVRSIGENAFSCIQGRNHLGTATSIKIACGVDSIASGAFGGHLPLENIYITAPEPPICLGGIGSYNSSRNKTVLNVLPEYNNTYKAAVYWSGFYSAKNVASIVPVEDVTLTMTKVENVQKGDSIRLTATFIPFQTTLQEIFWTSSNPDFAIVDNNGLVTIIDSEQGSPRAENERADGIECEIRAYSMYSVNPAAICRIYRGSSSTLDTIYDPDSYGIDYNNNVEFYNLQGQKVEGPRGKLRSGIYIAKQGNKVEKIIIN